MNKVNEQSEQAEEAPRARHHRTSQSLREQQTHQPIITAITL